MSRVARALRRLRGAPSAGAPASPPAWSAGSLPSPWDREAPPAARWCRICGWEGDAFDGVAHSESALCPTCGSIARDRFLFHCFVATTPRPAHRLRVLESGEEALAHL